MAVAHPEMQPPPSHVYQSTADDRSAWFPGGKINLPFDVKIPLSSRAPFDRFSTRASIPEVGESGTQLFSPTGRESRSLNFWKTILIGGFVLGEAGSLTTAGIGAYRDWKGIGDPRKNKRLKIVGGLGAGALTSIFCGIMEGTSISETAPAPFELSAESATALIEKYGALAPNGSVSNISCDMPSGTIENISFTSARTKQNIDAVVCSVDVSATGVGKIADVPALVMGTGRIFLPGNFSISIDGASALSPLYELTKDGTIEQKPGNAFEVDIDKNQNITRFRWVKLENEQFDIQNSTVATTIPQLYAFALPALMNTTEVLEVAFTTPKPTQTPTSVPEATATAVPTEAEKFLTEEVVQTLKLNEEAYGLTHEFDVKIYASMVPGSPREAQKGSVINGQIDYSPFIKVDKFERENPISDASIAKEKMAQAIAYKKFDLWQTNATDQQRESIKALLGKDVTQVTIEEYWAMVQAATNGSQYDDKLITLDDVLIPVYGYNADTKQMQWTNINPTNPILVGITDNTEYMTVYLNGGDSLKADGYGTIIRDGNIEVRVKFAESFDIKSFRLNSSIVYALNRLSFPVADQQPGELKVHNYDIDSQNPIIDPIFWNMITVKALDDGRYVGPLLIK